TRKQRHIARQPPPLVFDAHIRIKSFKNAAENKTTATAFSQVSQVSETQVTQNDKTNTIAIVVVLVVLYFNFKYSF
ncbi:MAG: hypothetical protein LBV16_01705, partial [Elusimicrobiota bacterium]|nr:hypothetical protein [Elusimicrobiota bacterium]